MTLTGEYTPVPELSAPAYPTIFGITLTPVVNGTLLAIAGLGLSAYLGSQLVMPVLQEIQTLNGSIAQKQADLTQKEAIIKQVNEVVARVNQAKAQNREVRGLFSTQEALDTLLLDLNRVIAQNQAQLLKFEPDYAASGVVNDGSLGPELNGQLKRQVTNVSFRGNFAQTLSIMQTIDRLQTLLVIQNLTAELQPPSDPKLKQPSNLITSTFKLIAYVPVVSSESAPAPPPSPPPAQPAQQ